MNKKVGLDCTFGCNPEPQSGFLLPFWLFLTEYMNYKYWILFKEFIESKSKKEGRGIKTLSAWGCRWLYPSIGTVKWGFSSPWPRDRECRSPTAAWAPARTEKVEGGWEPNHHHLFWMQFNKLMWSLWLVRYPLEFISNVGVLWAARLALQRSEDKGWLTWSYQANP